MTTLAHQPVMLPEALAALAIRPDGYYADGTFGRGGHSAAILEQLGPDGRLLALDRDPAASAAAAPWLHDPRFSFRRSPFSQMAAQVRAAWPDGQLDGALLDLGVSSPQLAEPERGFSFQSDGPLDMRMDPDSGEPVSEWLQRATATEIADTLFTLGEERYSRRIARAIVAARTLAPVTRTSELAEIVRSAIPRQDPGQHPATRTFQALRILINDELGELRAWLQSIVSVLRAGARLVVISFHSLEDRLVKRSFQGRDQAAPRLPRGLPVLPSAVHHPLRMLGKPQRPSAAECRANPRARSAVLRVAEFRP